MTAPPAVAWSGRSRFGANSRAALKIAASAAISSTGSAFGTAAGSATSSRKIALCCGSFGLPTMSRARATYFSNNSGDRFIASPRL